MLSLRLRIVNNIPSLLNHAKPFGGSPALKLVSQLRKETGASIQKCKDALQQSSNDIEAAIQLLRKRGEGINATHYGKLDSSTSFRISARVADDLRTAVISKTVTQTDFAAESELFVKFSEALNSAMCHSPDTPVESLHVSSAFSSLIHSTAITDVISELSSVLCEPVAAQTEEVITGDVVSVYVHNRSAYSDRVGGKASAVSFMIDGINDVKAKRISELGELIAKQVLAMCPKYINESDIPPSVIESEREVLKSRVSDASKLEKAFVGHMKRFVSENCLLKMDWIIPGSFPIDCSLTVNDVLNLECDALKVPQGALRIHRFVVVK